MLQFEQYSTRIWHFVLARGVPAIDAEDIFQEIWLGCWQSDSNHNNPGALFFKIANNKVADYWRKQDPKAEARELDELVSPHRPADLDQLQQQLLPLLNGADLNDEQSTALILHHLLGYSARECASILEVPEETVRSRLKYARKKIRKSGHRQTGVNQ